jgi:hypothetical protein
MRDWDLGMHMTKSGAICISILTTKSIQADAVGVSAAAASRARWVPTALSSWRRRYSARETRERKSSSRSCFFFLGLSDAAVAGDPARDPPATLPSRPRLVGGSSPAGRPPELPPGAAAGELFGILVELALDFVKTVAVKTQL